MTSAEFCFSDKIKDYMRHNGCIMAANGKTKSTTPHLELIKFNVMDT